MTRKIVKRSIFFCLFSAAVKLSNTPPVSTTSIPNYNINLASKPVVPPPQQPQQPSENYPNLVFEYFFLNL